MTLEEKAKKLASAVPLRRDIPFQDYIRTQLASMYYTGAVENGIIWHSLKKDPNDLPKFGHEVLNEDGDKVRYEPSGYSEQYPLLSGWIAFSENEERDVEVDAPVAWCEVPKYKE